MNASDPIRFADSVKATGYLLPDIGVIIGGKRYVFHPTADWALSPVLPARFWEKVAINPLTGCWLWLGAKGGHPRFPEHKYSQIAVWNDGKRTVTTAHRFAYEIVFGKIPEGYEPHHKCEVKLCVNPNHLEVVTHRENCRRRNNKGNGYRFFGGRQQ